MTTSWKAEFDPEDLAREVVRFCPRCKAGPDFSTTLCPDCGETGIPQGFCSVCESYWRLPIGANCPKHELPLDVPPETPVVYHSGDSAPDWVTLAHYPDILAASVARARLEAEGIPTNVAGERMGGSTMYQVATGGVMLQVPRPLIADARILLNQSWNIPVDPEGLDDAWDDLEPEPQALQNSVMHGAMILFVIGPLAFAAIGLLVLLVRS